jgi:hypothetical protein
MNDELSPDARTLLAEARASYSPDSQRIAAVRAALDVRLGALPAQGSGGGLPGRTGSAAVHAIALGVVAAALAGGVASLALRHEKARTPVPTAAASTPVQHGPRAGSPGIEPPAPSPVPSTANGDAAPALAVSDLPIARPPRGPVRSKEPPPPEAPRVEPTPLPSPVDSDDSLAREVSLLRAARAALDGGHAEQAIALLQRHAMLWPRGVLAEERLATQVFAMCALGRVTEAGTKARELEDLAPHSPHLARVRTSCAGSPAAAAP